MSRPKKELEIVIPKNYTMSEIKKICKKQKGCESCRFVVKQAMGGVCLVSPIGLTPANWKIGDGNENEQI